MQLRSRTTQYKMLLKCGRKLTQSNGAVMPLMRGCRVKHACHHTFRYFEFYLCSSSPGPGQLSASCEARLSPPGCARPHCFNKQAQQHRKWFSWFIFCLFLFVDASQAPGSAKSAPKSKRKSALQLAPQQPFSPFHVQLDRYQCHTPTAAAGSNQLQMAR